jgi:hypothetical protein
MILLCHVYNCPGASDMAERHGRILARLSELGLSLAETVHERALAAETTEETAELGLAFHRISRSVRQTLALEAKLERERQQELAQDRAKAQGGWEGARRREVQVRLAMERAILDECDEDEVEERLDGLRDRLELESIAGGFAADTPVEAHIARLRIDLGLGELEDEDDDADHDIAANHSPPPANPRCADTSPGADRPELADDYWRSSA